MKKSTNESLTKNTANLDEIVNNIDEFDEIYNSREFATTLINDLINRKRNVVGWKLVDENGLADNAEFRDALGIEYEFNFNYKYQDHVLPLTLIISGNVDVDQVPYNSGSWTQPEEGGNSKIDHQLLGSKLNLALFDNDGSEIDIKWVTPELVKKITKQIIQDYI